MFVTLEKKIKNLPPLVCDGLPARRMFNAGRVGESANFHSLVVGTVVRAAITPHHIQIKGSQNKKIMS